MASSSSGCTAYTYNARVIALLGLCFVKVPLCPRASRVRVCVLLICWLQNPFLSSVWSWFDHNSSTVLKTCFRSVLKKTKQLWNKLGETDAKDLCLRHCTVAIVTCRGIHGIWTWKWRAGSWRKTPPGQGQPGRWLKRHRQLHQQQPSNNLYKNSKTHQRSFSCVSNSLSCQKIWFLAEG